MPVGWYELISSDLCCCDSPHVGTWQGCADRTRPHRPVYLWWWSKEFGLLILPGLVALRNPVQKKVGAVVSVWLRSTVSGSIVSTKNKLPRGGDEPKQHNGVRSHRPIQTASDLRREVEPSLHHPFIGQYQNQYNWRYHVLFNEVPWSGSSHVDAALVDEYFISPRLYAPSIRLMRVC